MRKRRTHDDYVAEVKEVNPQIQVIGQFVNMNTKILHHCLEHDIYWYAYPDNILRGHGCKQCGFKITKNKNSKTHGKQHFTPVDRFGGQEGFEKCTYMIELRMTTVGRIISHC